MKRTRIGQWRLAVLFVAVLSLGGAAGAFAATGPDSLTIAVSGDGSELLRTWAARFMRAYPEQQLAVSAVAGSPEAVQTVLDGKADLACTDRPLGDAEKARGATALVFAKAPIVFAVHPSVTGIDTLTPDQILGIFSGKITNWADLGGPAGPIHPICRKPPATVRTALDAALPGFQSLDCQGPGAAESPAQALAATAATPGAIGFFAKPAVAASSLRILNYNGVPSSPENVSRGNYPLWLAFNLVYKPPLTPAARQFLTALGLPDGRTALANYGCLPLPIKLAAPEAR